MKLKQLLLFRDEDALVSKLAWDVPYVQIIPSVIPISEQHGQKIRHTVISLAPRNCSRVAAKLAHDERVICKQFPYIGHQAFQLVVIWILCFLCRMILLCWMIYFSWKTRFALKWLKEIKFCIKCSILGGRRSILMSKLEVARR